MIREQHSRRRELPWFDELSVRVLSSDRWDLETLIRTSLAGGLRPVAKTQKLSLPHQNNDGRRLCQSVALSKAHPMRRTRASS
jgi:hypothetical protein